MYHDDAYEVKIESDEDGFHLILKCEALDLDIRIEQVYEALYDQARSRIEPHLRERDEALRTRPTALYEDAEGYDLLDPKHPTFHERMSAIWDSRDKTERTPW